MMDAKMFRMTHVDKTPIPSPAITTNHGLQFDVSPYNLLQTGFAGIWNNLGIVPAIALKDVEDNCFRSCSTSSFASNSLCTKVGFINFNFTGKRTLTLTFRDQLGTNFNKNIIDRPGADTLQSGAISSSQIQGKTLNQSSWRFFLWLGNAYSN